MYLRRLLIGGGILLIAAFVAYSALVYTEDVVSTYPKYADGLRDGAKERGWLPPFVPPGAFDIREVHNLDTNQQWLRFSVSPEELGRLLGVVQPISLTEARARHRKPRRWSGGWPPELNRYPSASPRETLSLHEVTDQHGRLWCVAVDRAQSIVYGWTCQAPAG